MSLSNNGYIVKDIASCSEDYIVEQLHFHWGHSNNNTDGSEHLLEARAYPLEVMFDDEALIFGINAYLDARC